MGEARENPRLSYENVSFGVEGGKEEDERANARGGVFHDGQGKEEEAGGLRDASLQGRVTK